MRAVHILPLSCLALLVAATACGGISDPSQEQVSTITGSLTGGAAAPANARVALVWRDGTTGGYAVGADVPIVNGRFSMNLSVPTNAYFFPYDPDTTSSVTPSKPEDQPMPVPMPAPDSTEPAPPQGGGTDPGGKVPSGKIGTQDTASGQITDALTIAVSGFVVYADTNGNGALDLTGTNATSPDQLLGGNKELFLAYLKGGGALDYEKLRDTSGILPRQGFNLAWQKGRWLGLDLVELKLTSTPRLPSPVCYGGGTNVVDSSGGSGTFEDGGVAVPPTDPETDVGDPTPSPADGGYRFPDPSDPGLTCAPDGRSYKYAPAPIECPPDVPSTPRGLCGGGGDEPSVRCPTGGGYSSGALAPSDPVPEGWPCPVTVDGGPAPDSGPILDAGAGPG